MNLVDDPATSHWRRYVTSLLPPPPTLSTQTPRNARSSGIDDHHVAPRNVNVINDIIGGETSRHRDTVVLKAKTLKFAEIRWDNFGNFSRGKTRMDHLRRRELESLNKRERCVQVARERKRERTKCARRNAAQISQLPAIIANCNKIMYRARVCKFAIYNNNNYYYCYYYATYRCTFPSLLYWLVIVPLHYFIGAIIGDNYAVLSYKSLSYVLV